jgi:hypothetical protein
MSANKSPAKAKDDEGKQQSEFVTVRITSDCEYGSCNDVTEIPRAVLAPLRMALRVDDDPEGIAYAMTLPQNQPKAE